MKKIKEKSSEEPELIGEDNVEAEAALSESPEDAKKKKKKTIITIVSIMLAICVVSGVLLYFEPWMAMNKKEPIGMYGSMKSYNHYPADYDIDVTAVAPYMELDRNIYYGNGAEEYVIKFDADNTVDQNFFIRYIDIVISGNYEAYNKLFTDNYYKSYEPYTKFTPQMLYDIHIQKLGEEYKNGKTLYKYNVSYKIYNNTGTFRNDIGSDGSKPLYFEVINDNGTLKIDNINYYKF